MLTVMYFSVKVLGAGDVWMSDDNSGISGGSYVTAPAEVPRPVVVKQQLVTIMTSDRPLVVVLVFICSSWHPRAEALNGEDGLCQGRRA